MNLESKIGTINSTDEKVYNFLADFNNFRDLISEDRVKNWKISADQCTFTVDKIGEVGVKVLEKEPYKLIKLTGIDQTKFDFYFWIQLKQITKNDTKIKLTLKVEINMMLQAMVKKPLQQFLDSLVDRICKMNF